jgi:hypothetical protein
MPSTAPCVTQGLTLLGALAELVLTHLPTFLDG